MTPNGSPPAGTTWRWGRCRPPRSLTRRDMAGLQTPLATLLGDGRSAGSRPVDPVGRVCVHVAAVWWLQLVAHSSYRLDEVVVLGAKLGPHPSDMDVHGACPPEVVVAPHLLEQQLACEHPTGAAGQGFEQLELLVGEVQRVPSQPDLPGGFVDDEVSDGGCAVGVVAADDLHHQ